MISYWFTVIALSRNTCVAFLENWRPEAASPKYFEIFRKAQRKTVVMGFCFSIVSNWRPETFSKSNSVTGASLKFCDIFQKSYSVKNQGTDASGKLWLLKVLQIFLFKNNQTHWLKIKNILRASTKLNLNLKFYFSMIWFLCKTGMLFHL